MEQLRKVVTVGCLTYVLYGLISWFELGVFLPPFPVKPFLFLAFSIFGLISAFQFGLKKLDVIFFFWLILISIINQNFLEFFFTEESIINFQEFVEVYFQLLAVVLFALFNFLIIFRLIQLKLIFNLYFLILGLLVIVVFVFPKYIGLEECSIVFGVLYFLHDRFIKYNLNLSIQRVQLVLFGVALIEFVEWVILFG